MFASPIPPQHKSRIYVAQRTTLLLFTFSPQPHLAPHTLSNIHIKMASLGKYVSKLAGSRVLVIGGSSGIGFGVAEAAIQNGASSVFISSSSQTKISSAIERLKENNQSSKAQLHGFPCNLGSPDTLTSEVENLFTEVAKSGKLDHVVFTAGDKLAVGKLEDFTLDAIRQAGTVRFFAPLVVAQQLRKHLNESGSSSFTVATGGATEHVSKDWSIMYSYLSGLRGMIRGLAVDLAPIRVNAVAQGPTDTEIWSYVKEMGYWDNVTGHLKGRMTTGEIGKVEDVVEAYLYLMKNKNTSGSVVETTGGTLLS
ncbi:fusarubin cluster-dehydrogenase [Fusarium subglutinans]|uniref:Fusarubin cluster-dehydrogenase n=1 Tax=Gibberella subglutinans TaxID=42677 RepID=A0A8H5QB98_GIBSU|nr:fusarubin cluster-dehydrogenase [Fusarium subglutinans]KAF5611609.1 fusarubin cluster-dehydrogenase [Fusarium subglutinans]